KHLLHKDADFVTQNPETLPVEQLNATKSGQVLVDFPHSTTITDLTKEYLETLPKPSQSPQQLRQELNRVLGVSTTGDRNAVIYPRLLSEEEGPNGSELQRIW